VDIQTDEQREVSLTFIHNINDLGVVMVMMMMMKARL
jgi:hypothetical protein